MTQDGTKKLIENTLKAKEAAEQWRNVALVLAEALAALDFHDVDDVVPFSVAAEVEEAVKSGDIDNLFDLLKLR